MLRSSKSTDPRKLSSFQISRILALGRIGEVWWLALCEETDCHQTLPSDFAKSHWATVQVHQGESRWCV